MSLPARPTTPPRPDPEALLLAAIRDRDSQITSRLLGQWVHRRGMAPLHTFHRITLPNLEGEEACRWLELQIGSAPTGHGGTPPPLASMAAAPSAPSSVTKLEEPLTLAPPRDTSPAGEALEDLDAASGPAQAVVQGPEHPADPLELPLPAHLASLAAIDPWADPTTKPGEPLPAGLVSPEPPGPDGADRVSPEPMAMPGVMAGVIPVAVEDGSSKQQPAPVGEPIDPAGPTDWPTTLEPSAPIGWKRGFGFARTGLARGRRSLTSAGWLMRNFVDEALNGLHPEDLEEVSPPEPAEPDPRPGDSREASTAPARELEAEPKPEMGAEPPATATPIPATPIAATSIPGADPPENVAPLPLFTTGTDARPASPSSPFRLPQVPDGPAAVHPAPAPDALADLRSWLPDSAELPRVS